MKSTLLIIDAQNDFCLPNAPLEVKGAMTDMENIATFIQNKTPMGISQIITTFDDHMRNDIAHPLWWNQDTPLFTPITYADVKSGKYNVRDASNLLWTLTYLSKLEDQGNYPHIIWPYHCIAGTKGAALVDNVANAIRMWEVLTTRNNVVVRKGNNPNVEHYSAIKAEIVDPNDPTTDINYGLINKMMDSDVIYVAGEAFSHCVANTVRDLVKADGIDPKKIVILKDCTSNVPTFEFLGEKFEADMKNIGVTFCNSTDI